MVTEIMRPPQGCLMKRTIVSPAVIHHRKRGGCYGNGYVNPRFGGVKKKNNLVIGRVRILKRGESPQMHGAGDIDRKARRISADDDVITSRINRLGSESDTVDASAVAVAAVDIKFMVDIYAGSAFSMSPSPRSLPLPSFFNNKTQSDLVTVDDSATRDLRRLLRLE